jgi:hypothetical protein
MLVADYIDGEWQTPKYATVGNFFAQSSNGFVTLRTVDFEGMKAFKGETKSICSV